MAKTIIPILVDWESIKDYLGKADIVEVIRCKECIKKPFCTIYQKTNDEHGYCSMAERNKKMRLIDLDEVIDAIESTDWYHLFNGKLTKGVEDEDHALYKAKDVYKAIEGVPVVDAEPVRHGRFIGTEYDGYADGNPVYYEWKCSECGCIFEDDEPTYNYCPNCGAKMGEYDGTDK